MIDFKTATLADLKNEFIRLAAVYAEADRDRQAILVEITRRQNRAAAKATLNTLNPDERAALKDQL